MIAEGETKMGMWELRIINTKWSESSFDRIECDLRSRSLYDSLGRDLISTLWNLPLAIQWLHRQLTQRSEHQERILDEQVIGGQLSMSSARVLLIIV